MAYQLQPGLSQVQNKGAIPAVKATDEIFVYPQPSTLNKHIVQTYERNLFPLSNMECKVPLRTMKYEPASTRAEVQNGLFQQRYANKNVGKK